LKSEKERINEYLPDGRGVLKRKKIIPYCGASEARNHQEQESKNLKTSQAMGRAVFPIKKKERGRTSSPEEEEDHGLVLRVTTSISGTTRRSGKQLQEGGGLWKLNWSAGDRLEEEMVWRRVGLEKKRGRRPNASGS